jgi:acetyl-CoA carboxylase biotin carboxyl carrier protein
MEKKEIKPIAKTNVSAEGNFDITEINELLKAFTKSNVNELKLEKGDFKITIRQGGAITQTIMQAAPVAATIQAAPVAAVAVANAAPVTAPVAEPATNTVVVKSPMIGTFYRSAGPDKPLFINVGDEIAPGKVTCIIEAMKLFNEIESEVSGKIVKILVENATPVEYDQPLFIIEPA